MASRKEKDQTSAVSTENAPASRCEGLAASHCCQRSVLHKRVERRRCAGGGRGVIGPSPKSFPHPEHPACTSPRTEGAAGGSPFPAPLQGGLREDLFVLLLVQREGPSCQGRRRAGRDYDARVKNGPLSSPLLCLSVALTLPRTACRWSLTVFVFLCLAAALSIMSSMFSAPQSPVW